MQDLQLVVEVRVYSSIPVGTTSFTVLHVGILFEHVAASRAQSDHGGTRELLSSIISGSGDILDQDLTDIPRNQIA